MSRLNSLINVWNVSIMGFPPVQRIYSWKYVVMAIWIPSKQQLWIAYSADVVCLREKKKRHIFSSTKEVKPVIKACAVVCTYYGWLGNLPKRHYESLVFLFGITVKLYSSARVIRILIIGLSTANPLTSCSSTSTSNALVCPI